MDAQEKAREAQNEWRERERALVSVAEEERARVRRLESELREALGEAERARQRAREVEEEREREGRERDAREMEERDERERAERDAEDCIEVRRTWEWVEDEGTRKVYIGGAVVVRQMHVWLGARLAGENDARHGVSPWELVEAYGRLPHWCDGEKARPAVRPAAEDETGAVGEGERGGETGGAVQKACVCDGSEGYRGGRATGRA